MNYELNRYTTVTFVADGNTVSDRIKWLEGETPEDHNVRVMGLITEMRRIFDSPDFTIGDRYTYDEVYVDPTMGP